MATSSAPSSASTIARFYKTLSLEQPSATVLQSVALRVDSGSATYGDVLKTLYTSATVAQQSPADELVRMFFLALDRAPDAPLFSAMMDQLRAGKSLIDMAAFMLAAPGFALSDAGFPRHESFVSALLGRTLGAFSPDLATTLTGFLNDGVLSRAQMLAIVSGLPGVAVAPPARVETAMLYLAGAGREATTQELDLAPATTDARIIKALSAGGVSATGGALALFREGDAVRVYSELAADLVWNAATNVYTYGGKSSFKVFYSTDGGLTGSLVDFVPEMARGVTELDASAALGKGKLFYTAGTSGAAEVLGPLGGLVFTGGKLADVAVGSVGADTFYIAAGADTLTGGAGDDRFVLPVSAAYQGAGGAGGVTISDFGNGKDVLDFSRLLNKSVDISGLVAVMADAAPTAALRVVNGAIALVENNGVWVTGTGASMVSRAATAADVVALFGVGKLFGTPTQVTKSVVITADTRNSADVWLVLNNTLVTEINDGITGPQEVFHVAHLEGSWNVSLVGTLPVLLNP